MKKKCPRCGNSDPELFYQGSKGIYCRACVRFFRFLVSDTPEQDWQPFPDDLDEEYSLSFELTPAQKMISQEIVKQMDKKDVLVWAVTGAGKTELCMEFISQCLQKKKRIAVVIARRQVVLELAERFSQAFKCHVAAVCQGHTDNLDADLYVMTAHQCYRFFDRKFDHIIVDEPDAFPYHGDDVLQGIVRNSCRGTILYLSATPDQKLLKECQVLHLFCRPHGRDLPVPLIHRQSKLLVFFSLRSWCLSRKERGISFLVFVPTIQMAELLCLLLKRWVNVECCTSKTKEKDKVISLMKQKQVHGLVCTTILERGVTFSGIDVCVFCADHSVFDAASLVQIAGRVGRKPSRPTGECLFITSSKSFHVEESIRMIRYANENKMSFMQSKAA